MQRRRGGRGAGRRACAAPFETSAPARSLPSERHVLEAAHRRSRPRAAREPSNADLRAAARGGGSASSSRQSVERDVRQVATARARSPTHRQSTRRTRWHAASEKSQPDEVAAHELDVDEPGPGERTRPAGGRPTTRTPDQLAVVVELERSDVVHGRAGRRRIHDDDRGTPGILARCSDPAASEPPSARSPLVQVSPCPRPSLAASSPATRPSRSGPHVVLDRVSCTIGPQQPDRRGRAQRHRQVDAAQDPRRPRRARLGHASRAPRRRATVGYLPQEPERRPGETVRAYLAPPHRAWPRPSTRSTRASAALAPSRPRAPTTRTPTRSSATSRSARPTSTPASARCCADLGLPSRVLDLEMTALSGGQAARASLAAILLARFDVFLLDEPTNDLDFAGLDRLERFLRDELDGRRGDRLARPRVPRSHDHERARARRAHAHRAPSTRAAGRRTSTSRRPRAATPRRTTPSTAAQRDDLRRPGAATNGSGRCRAWPRSQEAGETDKFIRHFRRNSSEHVAAKAKITDRALERLEAERGRQAVGGLGPAHGDRGRAPRRRGRGAAHRRGRAARRLHARADRPADRLRRAGRDRSARTAAARPRCSTPSLGRLPLDAGDAHLGPGVVVGELDQARGAFAGADAAARPLRGRERARARTRPGRCSRSSAWAPIT